MWNNVEKPPTDQIVHPFGCLELPKPRRSLKHRELEHPADDSRDGNQPSPLLGEPGEAARHGLPDDRGQRNSYPHGPGRGVAERLDGFDDHERVAAAYRPDLLDNR